MIRWLDRRAWRIVLDPRSTGERLRRARRRIRREQLVRDAFGRDGP